MGNSGTEWIDPTSNWLYHAARGRNGATNKIWQSSVLILFRTRGNRGAGGNAYPHNPPHGRDKESESQARGSGNGDTKQGSLMFRLVANRPEECPEPGKFVQTLGQIATTRCGESVPVETKKSASTFSFPAMCLARISTPRLKK